MAKVIKNNLGFLGIDFQYKLIKTFMEEPSFFRELYPIIDQNMFTDPSLKTFVGVLKEYFAKNDLIPSYTMMGIKLHEKAYSEIELETYDATIKKVKETSTEGVDEIRELAQKFFKQQNMIRVANELLKVAGDGDIDKYDDCVKLLEEANNVGGDEDMGESPLDDTDEVLSDDYRITIPTGIKRIDEALEGGIGVGELGVIIGPSSFGKTSLTTAMASYAASYKCEANDNKGFKVLQIVFEDRVKQIKRKHIGRITQIEAKDLSKPEYIDIVKHTLDAYPDKELIKENIRIKKYPSGEKSPNDIKNFIKKLRNSGFVPKLVIIDYFECLIPDKEKNNSSSDSEWTKEGKTMRKLETMAEEFGVAIWVPTQGTKDSIGAELVTMDKSGGSIKKIQIGHIVMSIARSMENIKENKANIAILKNRAGQAGLIINGVNFNNGTCTISTDDVIEFDDALAYQDHEKEEKAKLIFETSKEVFNEINKNKK